MSYLYDFSLWIVIVLVAAVVAKVASLDGGFILAGSALMIAIRADSRARGVAGNLAKTIEAALGLLGVTRDLSGVVGKIIE